MAAQNRVMLSYPEQLLLLTVDPVSGRLFPVPDQVLHLTLAGSFLLEASFNNLINDDWKQLEVLETSVSSSHALEQALRCLLISERSVPISQAIAIVAAHGSTLNQLVWDSLEQKGMMTLQKQPVFNRKGTPKLFSPSLPLVIEIHKKIREAVLTDEVPDFHIPPLVSLIVAGGLTRFIFNPEETQHFRERISLLAGMESLGRMIIHSVQNLELANLDKEAAAWIGLKHSPPKTVAGGLDAVLSSLNFLYKEAGLRRSRKLIGNFNQHKGFECPGCAWPNPDENRSRFEFCENGAKNVSSAATTRLVNTDFFTKWPVHDLLLTSEYWLEQQGRLTEPMMLDEKSSHYRPVGWEEAFQVIAGELKSLNHPDEAVFYSSGRTSNEAAFLYQLFARAFGTNNLPNSANLCHDPSGKALTMALGFGKTNVTPEDFPKANAIFILGHNPGSNHPRMLSTLQSAVRNGCRIVAVNPMPESSLMNFADPQEPGTYLGKQTVLASLYVQPMINGDMAFIRGVAKATLEAEENGGGVVDSGFIRQYTSGFEAYKQTVTDTSWDALVLASGVAKQQILEAAEIYIHAENVIATWCLGITHHRNSIETISEIINLMLLKGNVGKAGSGLCPVRGHSNVQGLRTTGAGENMPLEFLQALENKYSVKVSRNSGLSAIPAIKSMADGKSKVLVSLGGNLASAIPDTSFVEQALRNCNLTVMISTKLNRSHLVTGRKALILPCLSRLEEDIRQGVNQTVSIEDAMGKIGFSRGCLAPPAPCPKSEISIVAGMARATLGEENKIEWQEFENDYQLIRTSISQVIPALKDLAEQSLSDQGFYLKNPLKDRIFPTDDGKAHFSSYPITMDAPKEGELLLMTIRSHDQFNTSVFGLNDRYRGISNERRILFMNNEDMVQRDISQEQMVDITSRYNDKERKIEGYYAIPYPIRKGCVAAYFPETNKLASIDHVNELCQTPAFKSISVQVRLSHRVH